MTSFDFSTYLSPFTTRYGSDAMRHIWSEEHKRLLWRKTWVSLAKAQEKAGLINKKELADIMHHQNTIDIEKSREREKTVYHELMAELQIFSKQCKIGGGKIHAGATSADILDSTTIMQIHESLVEMKQKLTKILSLFAEKITLYQGTICMGYTHLQPAEPTTLAYRFAFYAQDLLIDLQTLEALLPLIKSKGLKGAVGTQASFTILLKDTPFSPEKLEKDFLTSLGIDAFPISHQTYPRKVDLLVVELLANIAASLHKFCFDYRILQSPLFGEWMEKRNKKRVGSSAMPFKKNPDRAEKICSLCRYVSGFLSVSWSNPALSALERTLDDSASQRLFLPEAFLAIDDCLTNTAVLLENLEINMTAIEKNLATFAPFSATEPLLMELVKRGANRQEVHEVIKSCCMQPPPLLPLLLQEKAITSFLSKEEIEAICSPHAYIGTAKKRTKEFLKHVDNLGIIYKHSTL